MLHIQRSLEPIYAAALVSDQLTQVDRAHSILYRMEWDG
jgi:hypothetical protein